MVSGENVFSAGIIFKLTFKPFSVVKFVFQPFLGSRMGLGKKPSLFEVGFLKWKSRVLHSHFFPKMLVRENAE